MSSGRLTQLLNEILKYSNMISALPLATSQEVLKFVNCQIYGHRKEYEIRRQNNFNGLVGIGGQGIVFKANYASQNMDVVAVKFAHPNTSGSHQRLVKAKPRGDDRFRDKFFDMAQNVPDTRFLESAKLQALLYTQFSGDKNVIIPQVYEFRAVPSPYLIMSWAEGEDIIRCIKDKNMLEYSLGAFLKLASFISRLHELGYVHRDIKPENFKLGRQDKIVCYDFGLLKPMDRKDLTCAGVVLGTVPWASPRIMLGHAADIIDDIYALGMMLAAIVLHGDLGFENFKNQITNAYCYDIDILRKFLGSIFDRLPNFLQPIFGKATSTSGLNKSYDLVEEMIFDIEDALKKELGMPGFNLKYSNVATEDENKKEEKKIPKPANFSPIRFQSVSPTADTVICEEEGHQQENKENIQEKSWAGIFGQNFVEEKKDLELLFEEMNKINKEIFHCDCFNVQMDLCCKCKERKAYFCKKIVIGLNTFLYNALQNILKDKNKKG